MLRSWCVHSDKRDALWQVNLLSQHYATMQSHAFGFYSSQKDVPKDIFCVLAPLWLYFTEIWPALETQKACRQGLVVDTRSDKGELSGKLRLQKWEDENIAHARHQIWYDIHGRGRHGWLKVTWFTLVRPGISDGFHRCRPCRAARRRCPQRGGESALCAGRLCQGVLVGWYWFVPSGNLT